MFRKTLPAAIAVATLALIASRSGATEIFATVPDYLPDNKYNVVAVDSATGNSTTVVTGLPQPEGLAFGPDGNLYVVTRNTASNLNQNDYHIEEFIRTNTGPGPGTFTDAGIAPGYTTATPPGLATNIQGQGGLVIDAAGNAFVSTSGGVTEYKAGGGSIFITTPSNSSSPASVPNQLALNGNTLYVTDIGNYNVYTADLTQPLPTLTKFVNVPFLQGVTTDASGNVYVSYNGGIKEFSSNGTTSSSFGDVQRNLYGIVYDSGSSNFYVANPPMLYQINSLGHGTTVGNNPIPGAVFLALEPAAPAVSTPEPSSLTLLTLLGIGLAGRAGYGRLRRKA